MVSVCSASTVIFAFQVFSVLLLKRKSAKDPRPCFFAYGDVFGGGDFYDDYGYDGYGVDRSNWREKSDAAPGARPRRGGSSPSGS